ncbi:MFS transporter [Leifsonia sp. H3M29-4]|uniref:MFS transporter n=1 Tax=Salinibacterium metalliresistens TaxID=3031321 RepID=UPI0023DB2FBC|nr:MFS transporter [Salinibacterium metalliresistens]MDF1477811.1 MFS transporter [Salinibacterium metalliresistens]
MTMTSLKPVTPAFIALYAVGYVGSYIALITPVAATLAFKVAELDPAGKEASLGMIAAIGALVAIVSNAGTGALSDRTRSPLGRRRPWIIGGALGGVVALAIVGFAPSLFVVGLGWVLAQLTLNMVLAALQALLPDQVPLEQRGRVSAVLGIAQQVSPLLGIGLAFGVQAAGGGIGLMFLIPAVVGAALMVLLAVRIRDVAHEVPARASLGEFLRGFSIERGKRRDFGWAWFGRFFVILGFAVYTTYQPYFIADRLGVPESGVLLQQLIALLIFAAVLTVSAVVCGRLSDRTGRRKPFVFAAAAVVGVGLTMLALTTSLPVFYVAAAVMGVGIGAFFAVDLALITDVLPDKEHKAAKDMGIFNIANSLPQSVAPAIAPLFLAVGSGGGNYTVLFIAGGVFAVIGAVLIAPIRAVK